jgi:hypothetical protein
MKPTLNEDPFNAIAATLENQVKGLRAKFDAFKALTLSVDTSAEAGFGGKYEEIKSEVRKTCEQCTKMRNTVSSVEQKREQFPHIDDRELESRKNVAERLRVVSLSSLGAACFFFLCCLDLDKCLTFVSGPIVYAAAAALSLLSPS